MHMNIHDVHVEALNFVKLQCIMVLVIVVAVIMFMVLSL